MAVIAKFIFLFRIWCYDLIWRGSNSEIVAEISEFCCCRSASLVLFWITQANKGPTVTHTIYNLCKINDRYVTKIKTIKCQALYGNNYFLKAHKLPVPACPSSAWLNVLIIMLLILRIRLVTAHILAWLLEVTLWICCMWHHSCTYSSYNQYFHFNNGSHLYMKWVTCSDKPTENYYQLCRSPAINQSINHAGWERCTAWYKSGDATCDWWWTVMMNSDWKVNITLLLALLFPPTPEGNIWNIF